jgi:hypothetical protein
MGAQGLGWAGEAYSPAEITAFRTMLRSKANSIEGGTSEINLTWSPSGCWACRTRSSGGLTPNRRHSVLAFE